MKKRIIIIAITLVRFIITGVAQEPKKVHLVNNQYQCFVNIEMMNGEKIEAALSGLAADSIYLAPVEDNCVRAGGKFIKILKDCPDTSLSIEQVRTFKIKYDANIIYRDELDMRKKHLRKKNAG